METAEAIEIFQNGTTQRSGDHGDDGGGRHEDRNHLTTPHLRIPIGEIQNDTWEEACLERAKEGSCRYAARNRFRRHVAGRFKRRGDVEIEFRKSSGAEAADSEVERIPGADENGRRTEVSVAQACLGQRVYGSGKFADEPLKRRPI